MKKLIWAAALTLLLGACSKEEQPEPVEEAAAVVEAPTPEAVAEEAATETLEVVEESAAVEEPEDEPLVLAVADTSDATAREWKYREGEHYFRLVPTQPTVGGADKIEVAESFQYTCPHCRTLEPFINRWAENKDAGVRFVRIPAAWNNAGVYFAKIYYTQTILAREGTLKDSAAFHDAVFVQVHDRRTGLGSEKDAQRMFERFGVSAADFNKVWNSFEVNSKLRLGDDLVRRYGIVSVPSIVVNGKYRTSAADAGGYDELIELIDELTVREGLR